MTSHIFRFKGIDSAIRICFFLPMKMTDTPTETPPAFVDDYLLYQLASASQILSDEFHRKVKASGIKVHVWRVLACVIDQPGLMLTSLSKLVLYEQSRLTKIIDQMVDEGLVNKQPVAGDRRKMAIYVTPLGQEIVAPLLTLAKEHEKNVLENLTDSEQTMLKRMLNKLCKQRARVGETLTP